MINSGREWDWMDKKGNKEEKEEKNFFEVLQEMPFSRDRIGQ